MANELRTLIDDFAGRLSTIIEAEALERARSSVLAAFGVVTPRLPGRPPRTRSIVASKARRKLPRQLCPVPGCRNPAAPVFGMVCGKHRAVRKAKIRAYREARRAKKAQVATGRS
jgi:hypothetical protein